MQEGEGSRISKIEKNQQRCCSKKRLVIKRQSLCLKQRTRELLCIFSQLSQELIYADQLIKRASRWLATILHEEAEGYCF